MDYGLCLFFWQLSAKTVEFRRRLRQGETLAVIQAGLQLMNSSVLILTLQKLQILENAI